MDKYGLNLPRLGTACSKFSLSCFLDIHKILKVTLGLGDLQLWA